MQHNCTKHKSCLGGVPGVQATPEDWWLMPLPLFSTKSNWQNLGDSNLNISVRKGNHWSFLLDLLHPSPSWMPFLIYLGGNSGAMRIYQLHWLFFDKVKNFISGNKWAKVSSSPPRCEMSILLKLATKNCLDQIDHHSPEVLQLQFAFDSKGSAARTWQFRTIILPKEVQLHSASLDLILVRNWSWIAGLRQQLNAVMRRIICI